ncbi:MAG: ATP-binding protein [Proteobacteria bacterium]|nr:ATP-binding protein [Pseudomonadota bacterium]
MSIKIKFDNFRALKNQTIFLGKYLTVLAGFNATGKSTVLGALGTCMELKKKDGIPYGSKQFRADFGELFKGSVDFDKSGHKFELYLNENNDETKESRRCRVTWQDNNTRFRLIPSKHDENGKKISDAKFELPVLYLGLSRLYPLGEIDENKNKTLKKSFKFVNEDDESWYKENYKDILSIDGIESVDGVDVQGFKNTKSVIKTKHYDASGNSAGQDNLGQILLAILSFKKLRREDKFKSGGLLLIDEMDATLHPVAQERLLDLLIKSAKKLNFQVVVSTHSLTILKHVCNKTNSNTSSNDNNIELLYFDNSNRELIIRRNIPYINIKNNLLISFKKHQKIKLYSEDPEARWFIEKIVCDYIHKIDMKNVSIGCTQLISLLNADKEYFSNCIIVFDGDVQKKELNTINPCTQENPNYIVLPNTNNSSDETLKNPERELYDYLINLPHDHDYWKNAAEIELDFNYRYISEKGPFSSSYSGKDRDKLKHWFKEHQQAIEDTELFYYWSEDNKEIIDRFRKNFFEIMVRISERLMIPLPEKMKEEKKSGQTEHAEL